MIHSSIKKWAPWLTEQKADFNRVMEETKNPPFILSQKIAHAHPREHVAVVVYGGKRRGKTSYALQTAKQVFVMLGCHANEAWDLTLASLFWKSVDFFEMVEFINNNGYIWPVVIIDDAGKALGKQNWNIHRRSYEQTNNCFDVIGDPVTGFIATIPNLTRIQNIVKDDESTITVRITEHAHSPILRDASGHGRHVLPSGKIRITSNRDAYNSFVDTYCMMLPQHEYDEYYSIRREINSIAIGEAKRTAEIDDERLKSSLSYPNTSLPTSPIRASRPSPDAHLPTLPSPVGPGVKHLEERVSSSESA